MVPERVGMKSVARDGTDYEYTILLELDYKHFCTATKDRTGLFGELPPFIITQETGEKIKQWCSEGVSTEAVVKKIYGAVTLDELRSLYNHHPEHQKSLSQNFAKRKAELLNGEEDFIANPEN